MTTKIVVEWYSDQITAYVAILGSIILFIIIIKKLNCDITTDTTATNIKYPLSLKISIYILYFSEIVLLLGSIGVTMGLSIFKQISPLYDQFFICKFFILFTTVSTGLFEISLINVFVERLRISFKNTIFALSNCANYGLRIIFIILWIIVLLLVPIFLDSSPYNIYKEQIDYDGNGVTCSTLGSGKELSFGLMAILGSIGLMVFGGNITIWIIFLRKLYKLLKHTNSKCTNNNDDDMIIPIIKKHTMIVSIASLTTILAWLLTAGNILGQCPAIIDFFINIFVIFLSFDFNKYYYKLFKCDLFTKKCCNYFEKYIIRGMTNDELKLTEINSTNKSCSSTTV